MNTRKEPAEGESPARPIESPFGFDRFGALLALLVLAFLLPSVRETVWIQAGVAFAALVFAMAATGLWQERRGLVTVVGSIGIAGGILIALSPQSSAVASVGAFSQVVVLLVILTAVVRRVLKHDQVGVPTILGAIAAYFLIGLSYAWVYLALEGLVDGPILDPAVDGPPSYYSFVVLSTLGFGDVTPVNETAQRITAIEAITGQIFLATLVARLVSLYGQPRTKN